ncbi:hypothetical protein [Minwuia thermotolerans]|uniref:Uncharacterized protein n=1 Tax=Minwuia thermotolerans TaxID=2056226 RepID=A0A2M9G696_9PROT|nr:hypothetical protein [Minwuia thermotolerans]PJK31196.1 hypothetical protein CVT23_02915 [Minwuia thermotolerans]
MANDNILSRGKPYGIGITGGIVVGVIIVFASGWGVTSAAMEDAVHDAKVEPMASLCAAEAMRSWEAQGNTAEELAGWDNREKREELAKSVTSEWPVPDPLKDDINDACEGQMA